jgi:hypothetical protein
MWAYELACSTAGFHGVMADQRPAEPRTLDDVGAFPPLDPGERPTHEAPPEARGGIQFYRVNTDHRRLSRAELAAILAFPALFLLLAILGHANVGTPLTVGAVLLLLLGLVVFALSGRRE